jgi:hypothetical protein
MLEKLFVHDSEERDPEIMLPKGRIVSMHKEVTKF